MREREWVCVYAMCVCERESGCVCLFNVCVREREWVCVYAMCVCVRERVGVYYYEYPFLMNIHCIIGVRWLCMREMSNTAC